MTEKKKKKKKEKQNMKRMDRQLREDQIQVVDGVIKKCLALLIVGGCRLKL